MTANSINSITNTTNATTADVSTFSRTRNVEPASIMRQPSYSEGQNAYNAGQRVGANLIGYTTDSEQYEVRNIITSEINKENVISFLRGYEDYKETNRYFGKEFIGVVISDHFFEQLRSENGFENNHALMKNVATKLMRHFEMCGAAAQAEYIEEILTHEPLTKDDAKFLDRLAQEAIKYLN